MIMKTISSVIVFTSFVVFLFFRESFFPTTIRQVPRSSGGVFPLLICQGGFPYYSIGSVSHLIRRVIISDVISSKFRNEFHPQIWDPGISNFGSDDRTMKFRSTCLVHPCFLFSKTAVPVLFLTNLWVWKQSRRDVTLSSAIVLGFGLIQVRILYYDEGDACKSAFAISILASAFPTQPTNVNGFRSRQWVVKSSFTLWNSFSRCEVTLFLFWSLAEWAINEDEDRNCIILKKHTRPENNNELGRHDDFLFLRTQRNGGAIFADSRSDFIGTMETEIMVTTEQRRI